MKRIGILFIFLFAVAWSHITHAEGITWQTDYAAAAKQAESSGKPMVLFFTGSDWCTWCVRLEREILDTKEFADAAGSGFVFVKLDFPAQKPLDQKTTQQNKELQQKFHINAYPSIVIVDSSGRQLGSTGYQKMSPSQYAQHLKERAGLGK